MSYERDLALQTSELASILLLSPRASVMRPHDGGIIAVRIGVYQSVEPDQLLISHIVALFSTY